MSNSEKPTSFGPPTVSELLARIKRPAKAVVTSGMPYANGSIHLGHMAGSFVPADIYARWLRMLIGAEHVLYVCGTDDHGSTSEVTAVKAGVTTQEFISKIHDEQKTLLEKYNISLNVYSGTSRPECFPFHKKLSQEFLIKLNEKGFLQKRTTLQWFDPKVKRFLQDRFVTGTCPNPNCTNTKAYSDSCDECETEYDPKELKSPRSALSDATPELRETAHMWLNMWKALGPLTEWVKSKSKTWRQPVFTSVLNTVLPALRFEKSQEEIFKPLRASLPTHKTWYAPGKKIIVQLETLSDFETTEKIFQTAGISAVPVNEWAHRSITRDVSWGIPVPEEFGPDMAGKTLYVWPDSLIAPISFTQVALDTAGDKYVSLDSYWRNPEAKIYQFLGQDNVYFYSLMQGALWIGSQKDPSHLPSKNDFQLSENIFACYHLQVEGHKMSKSKGNFISADEMLTTRGYSADQVRYFLALLSLPEKSSSFDFKTFEERNKFLAGPLNAAFEKPVSAVHSKFNSKVPDGKLMPKIEAETQKTVARYLKSMEKAEYSTLLFAIENYARTINSLFTQFKPHDDRHDETERKDALFSCFYVLKNLMIMLYPFVPQTMEKLAATLNLDSKVFKVDNLGSGLPAGHTINEKQVYF